MRWTDFPEWVDAAFRDGRFDDVCNHAAESVAELWARGTAFFMRRSPGDGFQGREDFETAMTLVDDREPMYARIHLDLGMQMQVVHGRTDEALRIAARYRECRDPLIRGRVAQIESLCYGKLRDDAGAERAAVRSTRAYEEADCQEGLAQILDIRGRLHAARGALESAASFFAQSIAYKTLLGDRSGLAITLGNMGRMLLDYGDPPAARRCFAVDLAIVRERGEHAAIQRMRNDLARSLIDEALTCRDRNRAEEAVEQARGYLDEFEQGICDPVADSLACFYLWLDRSRACRVRASFDPELRSTGELEHAFAQAEGAFERRVQGKHGDFQYLQALLAAERARVAALLDAPDALEDFRRAAELLGRTHSAPQRICLLMDWARAAHARGRTGSAIPVLRRAIELGFRPGLTRFEPRVRELAEELGLSRINDGEVELADEVGLGSVPEDQADLCPRGYVFINRLGRSNFAEALHCVDLFDGTEVVIKRPLPDMDFEPFARQMQPVERRALAGIEHPAVVGFLRVGRERNGTHYLVLSYVEGVSLQDAIATRGDKEGEWQPPKPALEDGERLEILRRLAVALRLIHGHRIAHLDLSPDNVILRQGRADPVIIDFGIAWMIDSMGLHDQFRFGKPRYAAPERFEGSMRTFQQAAACDIYALGIISRDLFPGLEDPAWGNELWKEALRILVAIWTRDDPELRNSAEYAAEELHWICAAHSGG